MVSKAVAKYMHVWHLKKHRLRHAAFLREESKTVLELLNSTFLLEYAGIG
ncbi:hypothetical protein H8B13_03430 [Hymenobacter sp. BT188]|nr:hypothetical protein [Hymenobacter sp. BT188]MBC6605861.1 hypothetical protein [Hymenobacter sp. BT188]